MRTNSAGFIDLWLIIVVVVVVGVGTFAFIQLRQQSSQDQITKTTQTIEDDIARLEIATKQALSSFGDLINVTSETSCRETYNGWWSNGTTCHGYIFIKSRNLYISDDQPPDFTKKELAEILDSVAISQLDITDTSQIDTKGLYYSENYSINRSPVSFDDPVEPLVSLDNSDFLQGELDPEDEYLFGGLKIF